MFQGIVINKKPLSLPFDYVIVVDAFNDDERKSIQCLEKGLWITHGELLSKMFIRIRKKSTTPDSEESLFLKPKSVSYNSRYYINTTDFT